MAYEKIIEENFDQMNTLTLITLKGDTYALGPIRKILKEAKNFPFMTSDEQILFEKELDLNFWFNKSWQITTWLAVSEEYLRWLDHVQVIKGKE